MAALIAGIPPPVESIDPAFGAAVLWWTGRRFGPGGRADKVLQWTLEPPLSAEGTKVGRNDQCPCGSGKKFKKCCGC